MDGADPSSATWPGQNGKHRISFRNISALSFPSTLASPSANATRLPNGAEQDVTGQNTDRYIVVRHCAAKSTLNSTPGGITKSGYHRAINEIGRQATPVCDYSVLQ